MSYEKIGGPLFYLTSDESKDESYQFLCVLMVSKIMCNEFAVVIICVDIYLFL